MKKLLTLTLLLGSIGLVSLTAEAKTNDTTTISKGSAGTESSVQPGRRGRPRVYTQVRTVRRGIHVYRETYRITQYANGRTQTRLISRIRIR